MPLLTTKLIDSLPPANEVQKFYWDEKLKGFGIKVLASGRKIFVLQYRTLAGLARRTTLGDYEVLSLELARQRAMDLLREVACGKDPLDEKQAIREGATMRDLCEQYMEKHARIKKKPRSIKLDQSHIDRFILPAFGTRKVSDMDRTDIHNIHYKLRSTPIQANQVLQVLSKMFNLTEKWGWRPDHTNPVRHVEFYPVKKRERFLSMEELNRLNRFMAQAEVEGTEQIQVIAAYRLLILTGCRLSEIQTLKWEYVDLQHSCLRLPDSKTGAKDVQLGEVVLAVLSHIPRLQDNPYVIYGTLPGKHFSDLQGSWQRLRKRVGIPDVRIHDLRHTFASVAVGMGESLSMIGKLLGHTQIQTTERYAHLAVAPQKAAADRISSAIAHLMMSRPQLLSSPDNIPQN